MTKFSIPKSKKQSILSEALQQKKSSLTHSEGNFKVSFQYFDPSQRYGSSFRDWQQVGLLSKMMEVLKGYCNRPLASQLDGDKFAIYGNFPPAEKCLFTFPIHVPEDANWGRIHITGPAVIVGHIVRDTFYLVFLDKTHKFYLTKKVTDN